MSLGGRLRAGSGPLVGVAALLAEAHRRYAGTPQADELAEARRRLDAPLRVALAGKVKAGKSTLLNALVGEALAPTDAGECTRIVTWYREGVTYRVTMHPVDGPPEQVPFSRHDDALAVQLGHRGVADVERLVVDWPSPHLRTLTLIDTPGIGSLNTDLSARTHAFLVPEDRAGDADAVCYLMRHLHAADARFLEAFHDGARSTPMNAIGVLSRADEIGAGRLAALESAGSIARRYRADPQVRRLCQTVLPVAGLLAETGATLREDEYAALRPLVDIDRTTCNELLLSADRFTAPDAPTDVDPATRRRLLDRFGVYGIRLSLALIRSRQATSASALASALVARSGIEQLRAALTTQFAARADLLKARSALSVVSTVLRTHPLADDRDLVAAVERIVAGTHAFAEARMLNALRSGGAGIDGPSADEAERLLGGQGDGVAERLGLAEGPDDVVDGDQAPVDPGELRAAALEALARWRRRAEHPMAARAAVDAARVVARSCEGILAELDAAAATPSGGARHR